MSNEEKYYFSIYFKEFEEKLKLESVSLFMELIELRTNPKKLKAAFPDIIGELNSETCFIILFGYLISSSG